MLHTDQQLIASIHAGQSGAFDALYERHGRKVKAFLLRSGFDFCQADDLTQEIFIKVHRSLHTFDSAKGSFAGWLATISRNVARSHWKRVRGLDTIDPELACLTLTDDPDVSQQASQREEQTAIGDCIARLPESLEKVIRFRYVDAMTTRGIAEAMGMPESTIRSRLSQAQGLLMTCLRSKGVEL